MRDEERIKLHFGPYRQPRHRIGKVLRCEIRGELRVCAQSNSLIPWPIGDLGRGHRARIVCGDLIKAIKCESVIAVAHWWGVKPQTVTKWRRQLGIRNRPEGTCKLQRIYGNASWAKRGRAKANSRARDPVRRAKIAASRRGKPRPAHVVEAMRQAHLGSKRTAGTRRLMSETHKRRGTRPPWLNKPWEPWEDELVRTLVIREVAARTGRTVGAVKNRRSWLKVPDGRSRAERVKAGRSIAPAL